MTQQTFNIAVVGAGTMGQTHIKNAQQSIVVTLVFVVFLYPWGTPLFFLLSGAGSWFALRRRRARGTPTSGGEAGPE